MCCLAVLSATSSNSLRHSCCAFFSLAGGKPESTASLNLRRIFWSVVMNARGAARAEAAEGVSAHVRNAVSQHQVNARTTDKEGTRRTSSPPPLPRRVYARARVRVHVQPAHGGPLATRHILRCLRRRRRPLDGLASPCLSLGATTRQPTDHRPAKRVPSSNHNFRRQTRTTGGGSSRRRRQQQQQKPAGRLGESSTTTHARGRLRARHDASRPGRRAHDMA